MELGGHQLALEGEALAGLDLEVPEMLPQALQIVLQILALALGLAGPNSATFAQAAGRDTAATAGLFPLFFA